MPETFACSRSTIEALEKSMYVCKVCSQSRHQNSWQIALMSLELVLTQQNIEQTNLQLLLIKWNKYFPGGLFAIVI